MSPARESESGDEVDMPAPPLMATPTKAGLDLSVLYRLPKFIQPLSYSIAVGFSIPLRRFSGRVRIQLDVRSPTKSVYLNSKNLNLDNIKLLDRSSGEEWEAVELSTCNTIGVTRIDFADFLRVGSTQELAADFSGKIRTGLQGVYLNRFPDSENQEREGVATMFAATDARSFIPCWDQPDMKATFQLTAYVSPELTVLSNMDSSSSSVLEAASQQDHTLPPFLQELGGVGWREFVFDPTPKMSTYLLCIIVGQYSVTSLKHGETQLRVHAPLNREEEGEYALQVAARCLDIFNEFFGISYCLPKLDLIALSCISVGAMENWGLVTFRENSLLVNKKTASSAQLQSVAIIVAHEVSHQWFGNLVTMTWWSDLWLNEGFATFMQYYAVAQIHPEFLVWDQFCSDVLITSLQLDALENSHPVKVQVENPLDIDEVFDKISYKKGASIIRMLHSLLGEEAFKAGIRSYMKRFSFGNACTEDLWSCLGHVSDDLSVVEVMDCWVSNVGFPLIKVSLTRREEGEGAEFIRISQERFSAAHSCNHGLLWKVPIRLQLRSDSASAPVELASLLLKEGKIEVPLPGDLVPRLNLSNGGYVKVNPGFNFYFRTEYSGELSDAIEAAVTERSLQPVDRLSTIEDRVSLVLGEEGNTVALLKLVWRLGGEDSYLVWKNLASFFHVLRCIVWSSAVIADKFDRYVVSVMEPCLDKIGWNKSAEENHLTTMLRALLISQLGTRGCRRVVDRCRDLLSAITASSSTNMEVEAGLREVVVKVAMAGCSTHQVLDSLLPLLEVPQERNCVLQSLGYAANKDVLSRVLTLSLSPKLRDQEAVMVIESVCQNRNGYKLAWHFFKENLEHFHERYGHGLFLMSKLIKCVTENFSDDESLTEVTEFFAANTHLGCDRTIRQARENIALNIHWKNKGLDSVSKFLTELILD